MNQKRRVEFMGSEENDEIVEDDFSLSELLLQDTPEVKSIKSIYEKEYEYSEYLSAVEFSIARYYYEDNRKVKDKDVISALKNIKMNRDKPISFFIKDVEREIVENLIEPLEENPLTNHEFTMVLDYVLGVIDNRSWVEDKQAYVKWITYVLGFFSKEEEKKYERQFRKFAQKMGVTNAQVDMLLMKREADDFFKEGVFEGLDVSEVLDKDRAADDLETGFFLMTDEEKFDFLLDKGPDHVELVQSYILELAEKEDFEKLEDFYKKLNEKHKKFLVLHIIMATAYAAKDPAHSKFYLDEALRIVDEFEDFPREMREDMRESINSLTKLLFEESAEKPQEKKMKAKKTDRDAKQEKNIKKDR
jgi:hypothetical protein